MGREFELKFSADPGTQSGIRRAYAGPWQSISMETTYCDTPEGTLSALRWTLRRRLENGRSVCTLKTPASGGARGEWEVECDDFFRGLALLEALPDFPGDVHLTDLTLVPVCGARFLRQCARIPLAHGEAELALDEGVLIGSGREIPLCEVEVEAKSGPEEDVCSFARQLARDYDLQPEPRSKYQRALALAKEGL